MVRLLGISQLILETNHTPGDGTETIQNGMGPVFLVVWLCPSASFASSSSPILIASKLHDFPLLFDISLYFLGVVKGGEAFPLRYPSLQTREHLIEI